MEVPGKEILKEVPQIWETNPVCFLLFVDFSFDFFYIQLSIWNDHRDQKILKSPWRAGI